MNQNTKDILFVVLLVAAGITFLAGGGNWVSWGVALPVFLLAILWKSNDGEKDKTN